jgi:hypothetical protein
LAGFIVTEFEFGFRQAARMDGKRWNLRRELISHGFEGIGF